MKNIVYLVILVLFPLISLADSQRPAPSNTQVASPQKTNAKSDSNPQQQQYSVTPSPPVVVNVSSAPQSNAKSDGDGSNKNEGADSDWKLFVATLLIAVFNLAMALIANRQTKILNTEFISTHRPKIRIKHVWLVSEAEIFNTQEIRVDLVMVNAGDTSCTVTEIRFATTVVEKSHSIPIRLLDKVARKAIAIPFEPGVTHIYEHLSDGRKLSLAEVLAIRRKEEILYCMGDVEYKDGRGIPRKTAFYRAYRFPPRVNADLMSDGRFRLDETPDTDYEYQD